MEKILYTITMLNGKDGVAKDLLRDFGFVCLDGATYPSADKYKELDKTSWLDEDGVDVYRPNKRMKEAFNVEIPVGCEGERVNDSSYVREQLSKLERYLTDGLSPDGFSLYFPMEDIGYRGCDLVEISDKDFQKQGKYEIFTCKLVFSVSNPNDIWYGV